MIMMCLDDKRRFVIGKKHTTLVEDVANGGSCVHVGQGHLRNLCTFSQFYWEPKTALKIKVFKKM